jgi:hypothetical protein
VPRPSLWSLPRQGKPPGINPMNSSSRNAVYNRRISSMIRTAPRLLGRNWLIVILLAILTSRVMAADWSQPEQQLARKVAAVTGPGAVAFDLRNQSSLAKKDADDITRGLRAQLEAAGLRFVAPEQAAASVTVTLSENLQSFVWIAEIHQGTNEPAVVIVSLPRVDVASALHEPSPLIIRKAPLWSQEDRILDVAVFEEMSGQSHLAVLSPEQVSLFRFQDGRWQLDQNMPIAHRRPWPRDLRGRMILRGDHLFDAYLPGVFCQSSNGAPITLTCRESDDPWPLGGEPLVSAFFAPSRNFFTGVLTPGVGKQTSTAKFYSAVPLPRGNYVLWLLTGVDGSQHLLDGVTDQAAHWNWGSDLAAISTSCGAGWQVLATARGDGPNDSLRAYEFPDRDPVAVSPPIDFLGNITALWPEAKGKSAIAVARNLETGSYEAFRLTITCSQ